MMLKMVRIKIILTFAFVCFATPIFSEEPLWQVYSKEGYDFLRETNYKDAVISYNKALAECKVLPNAEAPTCATSVLNKLVLIYRYEGNSPEQRNVMERLLTVYQEIGDLAGQRNTLTRFLEFHQKNGDLEKQEKTLEQLLAIYSKASPTAEIREIIKYTRELAVVLCKQKNWTQAESRYRELLELCQAEFGHTSKPVADCLLQLANVMKHTKQAASAKPFRDQAAQIQSKLAKCNYPKLQSESEAFVAQLQQKVKKGWEPPQRMQPVQVVAEFRIWQNGQITHAKIRTSSGDEAMDQSALKAINNAELLENVPPACTDFIPTEFTFDYEVKKTPSK